MAAAAETKTDVKHVRGILKNTSSFDKGGSHSERSGCCEKEMKWDEMNILATYHPADKNYGHQKITDPPTPYHHMVEGEKSCDEGEAIDSQLLTDGLLKKSRAKILSRAAGSEEHEDDDDDNDFEHLTPEERAKKLEFSRKRKLHYNEFQAVRLHRQMINEDEDDDDDDGEEGGVSASPAAGVTQGGDVNQSNLDNAEASGTIEPME